MAERLSRSLLSPRTPMSNTSTQSKTFLSRKLIAFFISDPSRKPQKPKSTEEDVQDAKLIYYHPSYKVIEEKRRQVGMIEGLATFTESFAGPSNPLESIHTKQHILVVKQWEPNIWITLVSRNPQSITMKGNSVSEVLWHEGDTQETFLMAILKNLCAFFVLLHGSIRHYILENRIDALTDLLEDFIPAFFETVDTDKISLYNELNGFYYGPISQKTFLSIQSFVHRLKDAFSTIRYVSLLFDGYLIYNGMNPHDMLVLYSYLVCYNGSVDSLKLNTFPFGRAPTAASEPGGGASTFGRANFLKESDGYLFGSSRSSLFVPTLYFSDATSGKLVVLLFRRIVLIVIFEDTETVTDEKIFQNYTPMYISLLIRH
ncbi:hypothetical protein IE077_002505 [Cardiosporidium cionae]|uniref:CCZ1/INTU/HSP4 first Longin domain-containing protein n=1 Tax=Cardiosporidium cionae TaxID=476202 RepID=A0ABQ7JAM9_9APIC|nr:hypothetical protein IE077_002505 [Cardiosporidium cionae]|eukprot:KAF8821053.1 hypothetical protein IE077_002505 [Cardiosporidium cionae]